MKCSFVMLAGLLAFPVACTHNQSIRQPQTTAPATALVEQAGGNQAFKFEEQNGLFMIIKAKTGMKDLLMQSLAKSVAVFKQDASAPGVFVVHTFSTEPEKAFVYLLVDKNAGQGKAVNPLVTQLKRESDTYIESVDTYPLNAMFGKLPQGS